MKKMGKLESILDKSLVVSDIKKYIEYGKQAKEYQDFNPQYKIQEESLNVNPLSARSCRCYPCKC